MQLSQKKPLLRTMAKDNKIILGCVGATYGVRGWVKINSYTDPVTNILDYSEWFIEHQGQWRAISVEAAKPHGNGIIAKLAGIDDPETAKRYTNNPIGVDRTLLPKPLDNEYYWDDLIDLTVTNTVGATLGKVVEVRNTGANDILIIEGDKRHLVPFIDHVIQAVDLANQSIIVDWDEEF